jgi:hypothetical protein
MTLHHRWRWLSPLLGCVVILAILFIHIQLPATFIAPPGAAQSMGAAATWGHLDAAAQASPPASNTAAPPDTRMVLITEDGAYTPEQVAALQQPLAEALQYVQERTGMQLKAPVTINFNNDRGCKLSGVTYSRERRIVLYVCPDVEANRAVAIMAHEFVHQLASDHYGAPHYQADLMLSEGLAQWGAGKYKLGGQPDFRTLVGREYPNDLLPLATDSRGVNSFAIMRQLYDQWASFTEWIVATHGREALDQLYIGGNVRRPGSAPYERVLGTPFDGAEQQWKAWLQQ